MNASNYSNANNIPIVYADGILIQRRASTDLNVVLSGEIKKVSTSLLLLGGGQFNYVGGVYPVGSTLGNSGLSTALMGNNQFDPEQADIVYVPNGLGGYDRYFYSTAAGSVGWFNASNYSAGDSVSLKSGLIILRRGATVSVTIAPPSTYSSL